MVRLHWCCLPEVRPEGSCREDSSALAHFYERWAEFSVYVVLNRNANVHCGFLNLFRSVYRLEKLVSPQIGGVLLILKTGGDLCDGILRTDE